LETKKLSCIIGILDLQYPIFPFLLNLILVSFWTFCILVY